MESSKVQVNSNTSPTSPPAAALFDPIALQTAYLAAQLQGQLQQQQSASLAAPSSSAAAAAAALSKYPSSSPSGMSLLDVDRFSSLLPPQLQNFLQQEQQRNFLLQQNLSTPLASHYSAFQPTLSGAPELGLATNAGPSTTPSPSAASLDLMLMQMQMATAAAAGLLPAPFNLLPPTAALSLLTPQFRLPQLTSQMQSPLACANLGFDVNTLNAMVVKNELNANVSGVQQLSQDILNTATPLCNDSVEPTMRNLPSNLVVANSAATSGVPPSNQRDLTTCKQRRSHLKRATATDEMALLRALCNESCPEDGGNAPKKRLKLSAAQENVGDKWVRQQNKKALTSKGCEELSTDSEMTQRNTVKDSQGSTVESQGNSFDENSPNRHHPINHRPPAMEARFLECMTALALHSDLPLLAETENESEPKKESPSAIVTNATKAEVMSPVSDQENQQTTSDEVQVETSESHENVTNTREILMDTRREERQSWPDTAIDDELCQKLEDYKGANVPVIHAYVIPDKVSESSPSESEERCESIHSTPSVAVPMPVFKILLDRILQTMLDP